MGLEDLEEFGFGDFEAEGFQRDFEFVVVDVGVFVEVEERELRVVMLARDTHLA